jgi:hypothetical protein
MAGELLRRGGRGRRTYVMALLTTAALGGASCSCRARPGGATALAVNPAGTILCMVGNQLLIEENNGRVFVSEEISSADDSHFAPFRSMSPPLGNPAVLVNSTGVPDTYAVSEVWQRFPGSPVVFRGEATPATRHTTDGTTDSAGSAWTIQAQDATGAWSGVLGSGSAHNGGDERDTPETGALYVPQLMTVGVANPQVFACAGGRTQDGRARTTWLLEAIAPNAARGVRGSAPRIQDVLYGDRYFAPPPSEPLAPPPPTTPPTPPVAGAGDSTKWGEVTQCAMRQVGDDLTTRRLHMILVSNGHLFHSMASDWGTAFDGNGTPFSRFRAVSPWEDIEQATGVRYGPVSSATIVAQPNGVSIFFTAAAGGVYRIWHLVMLPGGTWRPAKDVLALSGDAPNGTVYEFNVAAGRCPKYGAGVWDESSTETVLALWGGSTQKEVLIIRVSTDGSTYSAWQGVPLGQMGGSFYLRDVRVTGRPFRDDGVAFP